MIRRCALILPLVALAACSSKSAPPAAVVSEPAVTSAAATTSAGGIPKSTRATSTPTAAGKSIDCSDPSLSQSDWVDGHCQGTGSQPTVDASGSVTTKDGSFVRYPDGLTVKIKSIRSKPATADEEEHDGKKGEVEVDLVESLSNSGSSPVDLSSEPVGFEATLFYGVNGYKATQWEGTGDTEVDLPQRLVPGSLADVNVTYTMPSGGLATLALTVSPNSTHYTEYTFTDVQTLLAP